MSRSLYFVVMSCYFGCTLAHGLNGALQSYRFVHGDDTGSGIFHTIQTATRQLTAFPLFALVARYAGTDTGYGFFAPQVGSSFRLEVTAIDSAGRAVAHIGRPVFSHPHGHLRFHSLLNRLQHIQTGPGEDTGRWTARHARALSHCMAQRLAQRQWGDRYTRLRCTVSVYRHPPLRGSDTRAEPQTVIIYQHTIPHQYRS